mmetsp:Transcript_8664/g.9935  ORF Transcript_8664/g.9935 Transcript_8664/m.9935 type:complete len:84 (-) Transcript_8664:74-325(-)
MRQDDHEARHKNKSKGRPTIPQEATLELSLPSSPVSLSNDLNDKDRIVDHPQSMRSSLLEWIELNSCQGKQFWLKYNQGRHLY